MTRTTENKSTPKPNDKCFIMFDGKLIPAIVKDANNAMKQFNAEFSHPDTGKSANMDNIPFERFRPQIKEKHG